jgi:thiamine-phosphate pyrophosphorylase
MSPRLPPALLALTPGDLDGARAASVLRAVAAARAAGLEGVLVREPRLHDRALLELLGELRSALGADGWLGLHDRAHLAAAAGVDGLHLGGRSLAPGEVRSWLGAGIALGLSTHAGDEERAPGDVDYVLHAPVFEVPGKGPPLGPAGLALAVRRLGLPVWGLGGITPATAPQVLASGASGVAVLRGILCAPDPAAATGAYLRALGS